jgi:excinuclease ABC subunit B
MGRASRHPEGKIIMYADNVTGSMRRAMEETSRRRAIQEEYNTKNGLSPQKIYTEIKNSLSARQKLEGDENLPSDEFLAEYLKQLKSRLELARRNLQFEKAAEIKTRIDEVKNKIPNE